MQCEVLLLICVMISPIKCARILAIMPLPSYSHQIAMQPLWRELSKRHELIVLTTDPSNEKLKNLTEIDLHFSYKYVDKESEKYMDRNKIYMLNNLQELREQFYNLTNAQLLHPEVQKLLRRPIKHFDLIIIEYIIPTALYGFIEKFNCPFIGVTTFDPGFHTYYALGNPAHPILHPDYKMEYFGKLTLMQRIQSTFYVLLLTTYQEFWGIPCQQKLVSKHFGPNYKNIYDTFTEASMLFVYTNPFFHLIRPLLPNIIQIGGGSHIGSKKPLPKDLQLILDNATQGFILFSLGSNVKSRAIANYTRKICMETFKELKYTVLWKYEHDDLPDKPKNVIIRKWLPQQDILGHPNIRLFITQGGLQSIEESIFNHVPMVTMHFHLDQVYNSKKSEELGLGLSVDYKTLNVRLFKTRILEVISNLKYKKKVEEFAERLKDQPMSGLEKAVWWTEYVLRHKGAKYLRNPGRDLPYYQYFLLDVLGVCFLTLIIVICMLLKCTNFVIRIRKHYFVNYKSKMD